jgi:hypothetical protein
VIHPPNGLTADAFFQKLQQDGNVFNATTNLTYAFDGLTGFNSNSFAAGILNFEGDQADVATAIATPIFTPGLTNPVPAAGFNGQGLSTPDPVGLGLGGGDPGATGDGGTDPATPTGGDGGGTVDGGNGGGFVPASPTEPDTSGPTDVDPNTINNPPPFVTPDEP